jgi:hypothetical protein
MSHEGIYQQPLITNELIVRHGAARDTVKYRVTMNSDGEPGNNGKWGNRHPAVILPFTAANINILSTNAIAAVVMENFVMLYIWHTGLDPLKKGDTREVIFTCERSATGINLPEARSEDGNLIDKIYPNPALDKVTIRYRIPENTGVKIRLFDITGKQVGMINHICQAPGYYSEDINIENLASGVYNCLFETSKKHESRKLIVPR